MHIGLAFAPLLIILAIVFIVINRLMLMKNRHHRVLKILVGSYMMILLISVFVYAFLPVKSSELQKISEKEAVQLTNALNEAIDSGRTEEIDPDYLKGEWSIDFAGDKLEIIPTEGHYEGTIVVERKNENDGIIEAAYYKNTIINGINVRVGQALEIKINNERLELIGNLGHIEHSFPLAKSEFPINQFIGDGHKLTFSDMDHNIQVLYLKIPKGLDLKNDQMLPLRYVGH